MKKITATKPAKLSMPKLYWVAVAYAGLIVAVAVAQLFFYDQLSEFAVDNTLLSGRVELVYLALSVVMAVFSLPYLLRMVVSPLMRVMSWVFAVMLPIVWFVGGIWLLEVTTMVYVQVGVLAGAGMGCVFAYCAQKAIGTPKIDQLKKTK